MIGCAFALAALMLGFALPGEAAEFPFAVEIDGHRVALQEHALYALPGSAITVQLEGKPSQFTMEYEGRHSQSSDGTVVFTAPGSGGIARAEIKRDDSDAKMRISVIATLPATEIVGGRLGDYRIDEYPQAPLRGDPAYLPPTEFVKLTAANAGTKISSNFSLGDFACKQTTSFPKYSVMQPKIAWKLERILTELNAAGIEVDSFVIMSGYRTPFYNRSIGNVRYSRHIYGDAADIYIDENPRDGVMDDLNGDGRYTKKDAEWLVTFIDGLARSGKLDGLLGGLSAYGTTSAHGPFVHVDTRGRLVRW
jgi:hypothetical protein